MSEEKLNQYVDKSEFASRKDVADGRNDPSGRYPKAEYVGVSSVNNIATGAKVVNVTLEKDVIDNKTKNVSRGNNIVVNNSSNIGVSTNGLTPSRSYGLRIEDKEISLNTPDAVSYTHLRAHET